MRKKIWYKRRVLKGEKTGRKIGYPTLNLAPEQFVGRLEFGVYAAKVKHKKKIYKAALFFGPRLVKNENNPVLEIYVLNFKESIYGKIVEFQIHDFIRVNLNFATLSELKKQIEYDIQQIEKLL